MILTVKFNHSFKLLIKMEYWILFVLFGIVCHCSGDASKCWTCTSEANFLDCRANGYLATCNSGDTGGCQTEVRNNNGALSVTKKCKAKSVCQSEETQFASQCTSGFYTTGAICYFCCTTDNCNVAVEGECVDDCQHVPEGDYHSCESCTKYRSCSSSVSAERDCAGGLVWNDKSKNCDWDYNSETCPDYNNIGTAEAFKCWKCENQASFEACNTNGYWETCNDGDTGGCQTRISYSNGALNSISKKCKQQQTCENEATNTDSRCPPSTEVHTAPNMDCNFCCTKSKCNYVAIDTCTETCDGISVTDYQSCISCDVYITCTANPTDNRPCAMGQDGNRLHWDNSVPGCVAESSTCPASTNAEAGACDNNPCQNNGVCQEEGDGYSCQCTQGYKGTDCEETDECDPNPCQNGGACTDGDNSYTCNCATGFKGTNCADTDECDPNPCQNGGVCTDGDSSYTCNCATGFKGTNCGDTDECDPNPCQNGGVCTDGDSSYTCACASGFKGTNCANTDECSPNPCQNSGNCIDGDNTYSCACASGFTGQNCQTSSPDASVCDNNPCQNDGTCDDSSEPYSCTCVSGYSGDNCETEDQPAATGCDTNPCQNGATCDDTSSPYTCTCASGFTGTNCEDATAGNQTTEGPVTCADSPCQNGGQCENQDGGYSCSCTSAYTGTNCETPISDPSQGGSNAQSGDESTGDDSVINQDLFWYGLGAGVAAGLIGIGCLVFFIGGRKPKKEKEDENEANGIPPMTTTMIHGPSKRQKTFNSLPRSTPAPVESVNEMQW